ncbi:GyrI-like domain-containing protein [Paenibacillus crassostreae]|uniref:Transcription activator effector-binding protein n=1 Tax=Paenibacillus crassostreae TaxID=1763538 RepID=A0A167BVZ0_9BACL|nr:effector binding domain-containing protein [Paenibacillus crassostreae]AOZ92555.1 AraC family transcriptional regulator [Paenibacillus crassostreae]OAB72504.1 transcription activator effector-binding protein [Paenibacillus crassostreae]
MRIEIMQTNQITSFVGIRAISLMTELGDNVNHAFKGLIEIKNEIKNITNPEVTYGITPPNYKGNSGLLDFYCCYEVDPLANLPHGMIQIHILPRVYSVTYYKGPASKTYSAYDFTSNWLKENRYEYDDVSYYFEKYDEKTIRENDDDRNEITIYCPIKKKVS